MKDLSVQLGSLTLEHPLMNAAGTCKLLDGTHSVKELARTTAAAIVVGSGTIESRTGNGGEVYWSESPYSLNTLGLNNPGKDKYQQYLPQMVGVAHDAGKKLCFSAAGFSPTEYAVLAAMALECKVDIVELNAGCPNVWGESGQKPIASFVPELMEEILSAVEEEVGVDALIAVKVSPFSDPFNLGRVAKVLASSKLVKIVTAINTIPNCYSLDSMGKPRIRATPLDGGNEVNLAGGAGAAVKAFGLGQVVQLRATLPKHIQIIGVGGIKTGQDILDYLRSGAVAIQIATTYLDEGPDAFARLLTEYTDLLG